MKFVYLNQYCFVIHPLPAERSSAAFFKKKYPCLAQIVKMKKILNKMKLARVSLELTLR